MLGGGQTYLHFLDQSISELGGALNLEFNSTKSLLFCMQVKKGNNLWHFV